MRLEIVSNKAAKYACMNFHYAKVVPAQFMGYSVFNNKDEWCGVILFGGGASVNMGTPFGLRYGHYLELSRVALNGKQESTSQSISIAIKLIKKHNPTIKLLISYADKAQFHYGVVYQATNWYFIGESESSGKDYLFNGEWRHDRTLNEYSKTFLSTLLKRKRSGKRKYIYPLDKSLIPLCKSLSKPYPKKENAVKAQETCAEHSSSEVAFVTT
jgi:hypothetical protein